MNEKSSFHNSTLEADRMELVIEVMAGIARNAVRRLSDCPPASQLAGFCTGALDRDSARQVLLHLASCTGCREWESSLHRHTFERPLFSHNLARLRKAEKEDPARTSTLAAELRTWLESIMSAESARIERNALLASFIDEKGKVGVCIPFQIVAGPLIDQRGRFNLTLATLEDPGQLPLVISLQNDLRRVELCVMQPAAEITIIADCEFLQSRPGNLDPLAMRLNLIQTPAERWEAPELLPHLRRLTELDADPVDCWDGFSAALAEMGRDWVESLAREIHALGSPGSAKAMARSVAEKLHTFDEIWNASNGQSHVEAAAAARALLEIADRTEYRPRRAADAGETRARAKRTSQFEGEKET